MNMTMVKSKKQMQNISQDMKMVKKIRSLFIKFTQMMRFFNKFEKTQNMYFLIKDEKSLKKYESIWNRVKTITGEKTDKQPVYDKIKIL